MKLKIFFVLFSNLIICNLQSQNITNTLGTGGLFTIKNGATTFFTLTQSTGNIDMLRSLNLANTTNLDTNAGVIRKNGLRLIHNFSRLAGSNNLFMGINSGNMTMTILARDNTGIGYSSLFSLTAGTQNSAFGVSSLFSNSTGYQNAAFGVSSLYSNTTGVNNSGFGNFTLYKNSTGNYNSAFGYSALGSSSDNMTGGSNSAFGMNSMRIISTGSYNTSVGMNSGYTIDAGSYNTLVGYLAGGDLYDVSNSIAIGSNSILNGNNCIVIGSNVNGAGANTIQLGNSSVTAAYTKVAWSYTSDRRLKTNIRNSALGLDFISKLRPVSYLRIDDESGKTEYGFIAQEVAELLKESGEENSGIITVNNEGTYNMRYNDLLAPMVKSIQELKSENNVLKEKLAGFEEIQKLLLEKLEKLESKNTQTNLTEK